MENIINQNATKDGPQDTVSNGIENYLSIYKYLIS